MRLTKRRNGRMMTNLAVTHAVGGQDLVNILCRFGNIFGEFGPEWTRGNGFRPGQDMTRRQVEKLARDAVKHWGMDAYDSDNDWSENNTDGEAAVIVAWAEQQIRRLFPAMVDDQFEQYVAQYGKPGDEDSDDE